MTVCKAIGCNCIPATGKDFCEQCESREDHTQSLSTKYPDQYKEVGDITEIDAFFIHQLFQFQDPSGCLQHASRLLLAGGAPNYKTMREARDTLTRWLQLNQGMNTI